LRAARSQGARTASARRASARVGALRASECVATRTGVPRDARPELAWLGQLDLVVERLPPVVNVAQLAVLVEEIVERRVRALAERLVDGGIVAARHCRAHTGLRPRRAAQKARRCGFLQLGKLRAEVLADLDAGEHVVRAFGEVARLLELIAQCGEALRCVRRGLVDVARRCVAERGHERLRGS